MLLIEFVDFFKEVLIMQSNNYQNCSKLIMYNNDPYLFGVLVNLLKMNFKDQEAVKCLSSLHDKYVIIPADKASNNIVFVCKSYYCEFI
jgi:hypothetical protein